MMQLIRDFLHIIGDAYEQVNGWLDDLTSNWSHRHWWFVILAPGYLLIFMFLFGALGLFVAKVTLP